MVSGIDTLLYYQLTSADTVSALSGTVSGDTLGTQILDKKIQDADGAGFFSATFPAVVGGAITSISLSGKSGDGLDNTISGNCVYVYDSTLDRIVTQLAPFIASTGGGGPFSNPNIVTTNTTISRVNLTANLSGGPGTTASFDGDVNISGNLGVSGDTGLSGTLVVSTCPFPTPFAHARLTGAGTAATTETHIGAGATINQDETGASQVVWNDTSKEFDISAAGTWELTVNGLITGADTTIVTLRITQTVGVNDTVLNTKALFVLGAVPWPATISAVFDVADTASIWASLQDDGSDNIQAQSGTTMTLRRLR